jgi:hypothetical protein
MTTVDIWAYTEPSFASTDITGYSVEALDGGIGKIDEDTYQVGSNFIVVDTGPWIFGKEVTLPVGVIDRIDIENETVYVHRTKDQIKNSPEFGSGRYDDDQYRTELGDYYGGGAGSASGD